MSEKENTARRCWGRFEVRANGDGVTKLVGHAATFNQPYELWPGYREQIAPGAFTRTLAEKADVRALFNHDPNIVLGRTRAGTLELREDRRGLAVEIEPPDTQQARDMLASITRGDVDQMSFGFRVTEAGDEIHSDEGGVLRTITDVDLFDVSVVTFPANEATTVEPEVRSRVEELSKGVETSITTSSFTSSKPAGDVTWTINDPNVVARRTNAERVADAISDGRKFREDAETLKREARLLDNKYKTG